jgi:hypothetical protein
MEYGSHGQFHPQLVMWFAIVLIVAITGLRRFLTERERQRTLRAVLERGQSLDPELLQKLVARQERPRTREGLLIGGITTAGTGIGLAIFGWVLGNRHGNPDALSPLLGVGGSVAGAGPGPAAPPPERGRAHLHRPGLC